MPYLFPPLELIHRIPGNMNPSEQDIASIKQTIEGVFSMWNCNITIVDVRITLLSICFEIKPQSGYSIKNLQKTKTDIEVRIAADVEIVENGNQTITIIVLPGKRPVIGLRNVLESKAFQEAGSPLSAAIGVNYSGDILLADIETLPHMLVAGTTGSGKTMYLDSIIMSLLYKATPDQVKFVLIDPKQVDLAYYEGIPHLLAPVIYEINQIFAMLDWVESEMMYRYEKFAQIGVKNVQAYNQHDPETLLPQIVVIIDEYSELMMDYKNEIESVVDRIGRLGRAAGIHLIIATQRPTSNVVTGSIKFNIPCRASFAVVDSRESTGILNRAGAQKLCGSGDMLFSFSSTSGMEHAQAPYVTEDEIKAVVKWVKDNNPKEALSDTIPLNDE